MPLPLVFSTPAYAAMAAAVCEETGFELGSVERTTFETGETCLQVHSPVYEREAVVIAGTMNDRESFDGLDLAWGLVSREVSRLTIVIPYFGYATMERMKTKRPGEIARGLSRTWFFSSIPRTPLGNRLILMDIHSESLVTPFVAGNAFPRHLYCEDLILGVIEECGAGQDYVIATADGGRSKWVQSYARRLGRPIAMVLKAREKVMESQASDTGNVHGRRVVIYDDMIRTGGSLLGAARIYREAGAASVGVVATHGVFPGRALQNIFDSGLIDDVHVTDTFPQPKNSGRLKVHSVVPLIGSALANPESLI